MSSLNRTMPTRQPWAKSLAFILFSLGLAFGNPAARAATTELFVDDWQNGIALYGFDPVAFFVDHRPRRGSASFEWKYAGAVFRFVNEGNRAAFKANPDVYIPRFGGYDPLALVRGIATAGNPLLWLIHGGRLYFFHDPASRAAFAANPAGVVKASDAAWPRIEPTIVP